MKHVLFGLLAVGLTAGMAGVGCSSDSSGGDDESAGAGGTVLNTGGTNATGGARSGGSGGGTSSGGNNASGGTTTNPASCPETEPAQFGDTCTDGDGPCTYDGDTCTCNTLGGNNAMWLCTAACPTAMPQDGDPCNYMGPACDYNGGADSCTCGGFGGNRTWNCNNGGAAGAGPGTNCPDAAPADGDPCDAQAFCNFGGGNMCVCDGSNWACF